MTTEQDARPTLLAEAIGGVRGAVDSSLPTLVFVLVNALSTLRAAAFAALAVAGVLAVLRVVRREPVRYAANGIVGVAISAFIAVRLGKAEGFFLPGIAVNAAYAVAFLGSIAVRRPLVGLIVKGLGRPAPVGKTALWLTGLWSAVFASRALIQGALYLAGAAGWLAAVKIAMGWPLTLGALGVTMLVLKRETPLPASQD